MKRMAVRGGKRNASGSSEWRRVPEKRGEEENFSNLEKKKGRKNPPRDKRLRWGGVATGGWREKRGIVLGRARERGRSEFQRIERRRCFWTTGRGKV